MQLPVLGLIFSLYSRMAVSSGSNHQHGVILSNGRSFTVRWQSTGQEICNEDAGFSGYVDTDDDRHTFFWTVPSRGDPNTDPVILWLTGGPGASGVTFGAFQELGPCLYTENDGMHSNAYSWANNATVIFVDQPINTGFSYSSHHVATLNESTNDLYNFVEAFFAALPEYASQKFYIAGESYGGSYVPALASRILENQDPSFRVSSIERPAASINLQGVLIGNGLMNVTVQRRGFHELGCTGGIVGPEPLLDVGSCREMVDNTPKCEELEAACDSSGHDLELCKISNTFCTQHMSGLIKRTGRNPYDIRKRCIPDEEGGENCMKDSDLTSWLNSTRVKNAFGVDSNVTFKPVNYELEAAFDANGEIGYPSDFLVTRLLDAGVRVLIYAGNMDWLCNAPGMRHLVDSLQWSGRDTFRFLPFSKMYLGDETGNIGHGNAGVQQAMRFSRQSAHELRLWGYHKKFNLLSFFEVDDAGHMAPGDKPREVLALIQKWHQGIL